MKLTVLMPSLNEEASIGQTISNIPFKIISGMGLEMKILLIDGGSTDKTVEIARSLNARVLHSSRGYGRQYKLGFKEASGDIIITGDSDNSYPMQEIPKFLEILEKENLEFISANRYADMAPGSMRLINGFGNRLLTFMTNALFSLSLRDSQSGMWVIRKNCLDKIILKSNGMPLSQEIKIEAFTKLRAREINSSYAKRVGKVKLRVFRDGWDNITHLIKKRLGMD